MNTSARQIFAPLLSATRAMADAAGTAQADLIEGAGNARDHLNSGIEHSLHDIGESNARIQAATKRIVGLAKASRVQATESGRTLLNDALDHFSQARNRLKSDLVAGSNDAAQRYRKASAQLETSATQAKAWARKNPHLVVATLAVAGYLLIRRYRRRRQLTHSDANSNTMPLRRDSRVATTDTETAN
ncbi:MAG: hypothetical protein P4L92_23180 [Rudaea sp.]|nr:hypothetical protein [Rudaea sp.]